MAFALVYVKLTTLCYIALHLMPKVDGFESSHPDLKLK
ncbi:hypothetical protein Psta_1305 [Pirellula staleyi DSM 6068]|uniref:Uncharacterized protein n=1 Tax=Pirellula staleyi (strain ATCC 27377 / DSM 6068 / ICPB 4128) TaxID=530564 RepID=D2QWA7_PIRSD|nr:hypothetical protein Psta_1305 [Pirellula staleyi DSM 6068]